MVETPNDVPTSTSAVLNRTAEQVAEPALFRIKRQQLVAQKRHVAVFDLGQTPADAEWSASESTG